MAVKQIVFTIGGGEVELEASGFKGGACEAAAKGFEEILGAEIKNKKRKAEYYEKEPAVRLTTGNSK